MARRKSPQPAADPAPLTAAAILAAADVKLVELAVPEWGGSIHVKTWTAGEREAFEAAMLQGGKLAREAFRARVVQLSACDAAGVLLFAPDQIDALQRKSAAAIERVFQAADRLNTVTGQAQDDLQGN